MSADRLGVAAVVWIAAMALAGCVPGPPLFGPDTPRNGAGQPVDPVYGLPLPGYPLLNVP